LTSEVIHPKDEKTKNLLSVATKKAIHPLTRMETRCRFDVARLLKRKENSSQGHRRLLEVHLRCRKNVSLRPGSGILTRFPFDRSAKCVVGLSWALKVAPQNPREKTPLMVKFSDHNSLAAHQRALKVALQNPSTRHKRIARTEVRHKGKRNTLHL